MPGLVTRALAPWVDQVHLGLPEARPRIRPGRTTDVFEFGNPVELRPPARGFDWPAGRVLLVFGGSQGARALNELMVQGLAGTNEWPEDASLVWVTGPGHYESAEESIRESVWASRVRLAPFIPALGAQLDRVSLAICRSGAMTCAELAAAGIPSILVPLPTAAGDHQRFNALAMREAGAALMREEDSVSGPELLKEALELLANSTKLSAMAAASLRRGRPDASDRIVAQMLTLAGRSGDGADG
jgi:UDP-N-acetylglucosamine--N-acetylmuramyl-(pentapeptide) pyrophosphoryl-undecaprenol N-acetylglucosamine transferase